MNRNFGLTRTAVLTVPERRGWKDRTRGAGTGLSRSNSGERIRILSRYISCQIG
jgi:hypothetical protein